MTFNEYQAFCESTAKYPESCRLLYPVLEAVGEAGELARKTLTLLFPGNGKERLDNPNLDDLFYTLREADRAGEAAERLKKLIRDRTGEVPGGVLAHVAKYTGQITDAQTRAFVLEAGDLLYSVSSLASGLSLYLSTIAEENEAKLRSRQQRNQIGGSGDDR